MKLLLAKILFQLHYFTGIDLYRFSGDPRVAAENAGYSNGQTFFTSRVGDNYALRDPFSPRKRYTGKTLRIFSVCNPPPPPPLHPSTLFSPQLQIKCQYMINHYVKIYHVRRGCRRGGGGGGHKRKRFNSANLMKWHLNISPAVEPFQKLFECNLPKKGFLGINLNFKLNSQK